MDKKYNHQIVELNKNQKWINKEYFSIHDKKKKPFSIILPPPNVTGKLHLGHAWDGYIQDTIIRYKKLQGYDVLFLPAMDHAGIATQSKIEEKLFHEGIDKFKLGREKFLEKSFEWKNEYASIIKKQWFKLGLALDYSNERFTLDSKANEAVNEVFINLYNKGLIYKGKKAINWDVKLKTAISNIEVENQETKSKMYYLKYFLEDKKNYIIIATTRPETIFSDVAVAFNPEDRDKKIFLNQKVINPLTSELIPIISDNYIKKDFASGFMKVSAHAINDIDIILKNNLIIKECINEDGKMNELALNFQGLDRFEAREKIIDYLKKHNFVEREEEIENSIGISQRSSTVVEVLVKEQWFLKMKHFSKLVLSSLKDHDKVKFYPNRFEKILQKWMEDAHDWTLSRQLWWGHRIPVWYYKDEIKVQIDSPGIKWKQDEDVLDTWFSSGLAPFSFLGWPNNNELLNRFFPTSLLVTGYDIIFFWVARMYFFSLEFKNNIPFQNVLIHGLIRDENGKKMSKSLGNGIDPMDVIDEFGSDALRWFLLTNSTPGQDINFNREKISMAWALCNKLWNITRFILSMEEDNNHEMSVVDKWISNKLFELEKSIEKNIEKYEFTIIGKDIYKFIYLDFSSWYIEFSKARSNKKNAIQILSKLLIMIHPFLPFLSDELYWKINQKELLEETKNSFKFYPNTAHIDEAINIITLIRKYREDKNIGKNIIINYYLENYSDQNLIVEIVNKLANAKLQKKDFDSNIKMLSENFYIFYSKEDLQEEILKLEKEINILKLEVARSEKIIKNENFLKKATAEKIAMEEDKYSNYKMQLALKEKELTKIK
ncbi:MAG: valine--tRNA ligase [Metamycoplasmataceae bacterium]